MFSPNFTRLYHEDLQVCYFFLPFKNLLLKYMKMIFRVLKKNLLLKSQDDLVAKLLKNLLLKQEDDLESFEKDHKYIILPNL